MTFRNNVEPDGAAGAHLGRVHARQRRRRRRRALERGDLALPADRFRAEDHLTQRYGANFLPADMTIQDWGVTYDELEPHYDAFEYLCGTSGTAGNLNGQIQAGRQSVRRPALAALSDTGAEAGLRPHAVRARPRRELGYKPFPQPSGNLSQAYTNPLGVTLGPVHLLRLLRMVRLRQLFQGEPADHHPAGAVAQIRISKARSECEVTRINLDRYRQARDRRHLRRFIGRGMGAAGRSGAAVRLLALQRAAAAALRHRHSPTIRQPGKARSGATSPIRPMSSALGFFDKDKYNFNPFIASGAIGMCIDEFNGDNFDHGPLGFVGGGYIGQVQTNGRPIESDRGAARHAGLGHRNGSRRSRTIISRTINCRRRRAMAPSTAYRDDLSRPRSDLQGPFRPAADAHDHRFPRQRAEDERVPHRQVRRDSRAMGAKQVVKQPRKAPYDVTQYQTSHLCGGAIMGDRSGQQRAQSLSAELGRAQSVRAGRLRVSAECRLQPDRHRGGARLIGPPRRSARNISKTRVRWSMRDGKPSVRNAALALWRSPSRRALAAGRTPGHRRPGFRQIERGRYLATVGDCAACHTLPGSGRAFAGGRAIETPFGRPAGAQHHARPGNRDRRLDRRGIRQRDDEGHRP